MAAARSPRRSTKPAPPNSLVSSARILGAAKRGAVPTPASWTEEAWGYYDTVGEVRFACSWYANALSRARLCLATRGKGGEAPSPLEIDDPRNDLLEDLAGGATGQSQLLAAFAPHLVVPGVCYLVGIDEPDGSRTWKVLSSAEIDTKDGAWRVKTSENGFTSLPAESLPVEVWRPHARYHWQADSPIRALLPILRELALLTAHVDASATSRLAGNGVLVFPSEATFPVPAKYAEDEDPFLSEFMDAMLTPIADRDAASAMVPFLLRIPGDYIDKVKHLTFSTPFDEAAMGLRSEAVRRFANGMDMPAEVLLGLGDSNHWTAWQIEEGSVKLHVVPMLETICDGLTTGWWEPTADVLASLGEPVTGAEDLVVWYDIAGLTVRPDRSGDAKDLYDRKVIGSKALLRECGFDVEDAPTDEEIARAVLLSVVVSAPTLAPIILPALGIPVDLPEEPLPSSPAEAAAADTPPPDSTSGADGPPTKPTVPPAGPDTVAASAAVSEAALVAACDVLVWRTLERVGSRLKNAARSAGADLSGLAGPAEAHLHVDASCLSDFDALLAGSWDRVPDIAARAGVDPAGLTLALDRYTRALLAAQVPHSFDALEAALIGPA